MILYRLQSVLVCIIIADLRDNVTPILWLFTEDGPLSPNFSYVFANEKLRWLSYIICCLFNTFFI